MIFVIGSQLENILFSDTLNIESASDVDGVRWHNFWVVAAMS